jgi:hypothetical protein
LEGSTTPPDEDSNGFLRQREIEQESEAAWEASRPQREEEKREEAKKAAGAKMQAVKDKEELQDLQARLNKKQGLREEWKEGESVDGECHSASTDYHLADTAVEEVSSVPLEYQGKDSEWQICISTVRHTLLLTARNTSGS